MMSKGFALLNQEANGISTSPMSEFQGKILIVQDFADDGGVLVLNHKATALGMFEAKDVKRSFKCDFIGTGPDFYICPWNLNLIEKAAYVHRLTTRKGGYSKELRDFIVAMSLARGEYCDDGIFNS